MSINKKLYPLLAVNLIGSLGFSLILPFLIFLVKRFGGNEVAYGLLGSTYPFFQLIGSPVLGRWSDTYGRKIILLLSQVGTLLAWLLFLLALFIPDILLAEIDAEFTGRITLTLPLLLLFIARGLDGLTGGNVSVAYAYLADISTEKNRQAHFGKMGAAGNIGFVTGPLLAGVLGSTLFKEVPPVLAAVVVSAIGVWLIIRFLPESTDRKNEAVFSFRRENRKEGAETKQSVPFGELLKVKGFAFLLVLYFITFLGFSFFYTSFPLHAADSLKWSLGQLSIYFTLLSGLMTLVQGPLISYLSAKVKAKSMVFIGSIFLCGSFLLLLTGQNTWTYFSAALFALGNGLMWPSFLSIYAALGRTETQGAIQGVGNSAGSLAMIIGMATAGFLYQQLGELTFLFSASFIFVSGSLMLFSNVKS